MFAATQQHFLILKLKERMSHVHVGLDPVWIPLSMPWPFWFATEITVGASRVSASPEKPHLVSPQLPNSQPRFQTPFLVHRVDAVVPPLLLWPLWGFHEAETSGHPKTKNILTPSSSQDQTGQLGKSEESHSLNFIFICLPTVFSDPSVPTRPGSCCCSRAQITLPWNNPNLWDWSPPSPQTNRSHQDSLSSMEKKVFPPPSSLLITCSEAQVGIIWILHG